MLKYVLLIFLIFIAVWAWPVTLGVLLFLIVYTIIRAIYRSHRKNARDTAVQGVAVMERASLHNDWKLLTSTIVKSIKQHWNVLEDKFEQHVDEDDYGNRFIDDTFGKEVIYFSHKVVLPTLNKLKESGEVKENSFALLPAPSSTLEYLYGIKYEDSDSAIADKYVRGLLEDGKDNSISDELLYSMYKEGSPTVTVENGSDNPLDTSSLLTLNMNGGLRANKPMKVTHLAGIVFILFYAMYNNKPSASKSKVLSSPIDFTGNDPYKYEEFIRKLLHARGFSAKRTRGSGDYGVDVVASKNGKTFAIQCKLYNHTVGFKAVQEIVSGRVYYKTDFAIVVSDNSFTDAAKSMARRSDVILTHHKNLLHKLESLIPDDDETHDDNELDGPVDNQASHEPVLKNQWTQADGDELITAILPVINSKN